ISLNGSCKRASGSLGESILLQIKPNKIQGFGAVIRVMYVDCSGNGMAFIIQGCFQIIDRGILPILRAGFSGGCAIHIFLSVTYIIKKLLIVSICLLGIYGEVQT